MVNRLFDEFGNIPKFLSTTVGAVTIPSNMLCGQVTVAAAASTVVVTAPQIQATSLVFCQLVSADATATSVKGVTISAGTSFTLTLNAAATGNTVINFLIIL